MQGWGTGFVSYSTLVWLLGNLGFFPGDTAFFAEGEIGHVGGYSGQIACFYGRVGLLVAGADAVDPVLHMADGFGLALEGFSARTVGFFRREAQA